MQAVTLNIDSRGQIRLPKKMRSMFDQSVILQVVDDEHIMISPILDLAGSLNKYKNNIKDTDAWETTRQKAWEESTKGRG
jgi:DNA-binding transcriptional regulator/RsmH inhibitor MraZ